MLLLTVQLVLANNSTQVPKHLIHPAISLSQTIQVERSRKEGAMGFSNNLLIPLSPRIQAELNSKDRALEITPNLMVLPGQKIQVELGMKEGATMPTHSSPDLIVRTPEPIQEAA
jgi:hypothetical protein